MLTDRPMRASLQVAPLTIQKPKSSSPTSTSTSSAAAAAAAAATVAATPRSTVAASISSSSINNTSSRSQMTPPATPNGSQENLTSPVTAPPVFHNFLRAFYDFNPSYAMSDSSVTLPLAEGDVILVHSIHTNGWADGTLLVSGARGWLPTNYCEAYDPDEMKNLLKALLNFWDLLRSTSVNDKEIFGNQEFMKGIIAGVRYLLDRTQCLTREAQVVQRNETLRKGRKSLLSDLSSLVKTAKKLQELQKATTIPRREHIVNDTVDEMILKAFKIVTKGVRFLDSVEDDKQARALPATTTKVLSTLAEESYIPPTPPAETNGFNSGSSSTTTTTTTTTPTTTTKPALTNKRMSTINNNNNNNNRPPSSSRRMSQSSRPLSTISHRVSLAGPSPLSRPQHLVSERLSKSHDAFLSHLSSFIGRLHLQSHSRPETAWAIRQSVTSGGELLTVIDAVGGQNVHSADLLSDGRAAFFNRLQDLVAVAREILSNTRQEEADVILPHDNSMLRAAATGCVKTAGDAVAKTKWIIERIGDFEFEGDGADLGIDLSALEAILVEERRRTLSVAESTATTTDTESTTGSAPTSATTTTTTVNRFAVDKPLPKVPLAFEQQNAAAAAAAVISGERSPSRTSSTKSSIKHVLPPLPKLDTSFGSHSMDSPGEPYSATTDRDSHVSSSFGSMTALSAGSSGTFLSMESDTTRASQNSSTRSSTPDTVAMPRNKQSFSELSSTSGGGGAYGGGGGGSSSSSSGHGAHGGSDEVDDLESNLLEKTFAHELMFNKEGQVTAGSLSALVERLTTHESTPDAVFVSAFYLTFRLFCTPIELADSLVDRFDYVGEYPRVSGPVRLRVYNVFKGWLESHWREETDRKAMDVIVKFADLKLSPVLPSAGQRLLALAQRVSSQGALVPRLVSTMMGGKTGQSAAPADTPVPQPIISKSQFNLLANWRIGGTNPTILDFDPLELARQLTLKQMNTFCSIVPEELLASQWMKNGGVDAPNVKAMSALSTDLSNLVAETILQHSEVKKRANVIKHWIKIAQSLLLLHNYDGLMAIICSLNSSTISRLRRTWDLISSKRRDTLRSLQNLVEPSQNNKILRSRLSDHVPPCLPFLGMYLTDLTFVDIGNPATKQLHVLGGDDDNGGGGGGGGSGNGVNDLTLVNFDKHIRTAKIIGELQRFQIPYRLTEVYEMQDWMTAQIASMRDNDQGNVQVTYYRKSLLLEPREVPIRTPLESPGINAGVFSWVSRDRGGSITPTPI